MARLKITRWRKVTADSCKLALWHWSDCEILQTGNTRNKNILKLDEKEEVMKAMRFTMFLLVACMLVLLAGQSAFGAIKIVKFTVPSCE